MALPALRGLATALSERTPPESLDVWTPRPFAPLLAALVGEVEVLPFDLGRGGITRLRGRLRLARRMRSREYRVAVLFPNSFGSALAAWRAGVPERIGTPLHLRGMLITKKVEPQGAAEHLAEAYVRLAEAGVGGFVGRSAPEAPDALPEAVRSRARAILAEAGLGDDEAFVAMAPGAAYGPAKQWGAANFAAVARLTRADSKAAAEIARGAEGARVIDMTGRTDLLELAGVMSLGKGFVGNDSGAAHLAGALGVPTVAVYLSTDPVRTGQRGPRVRLVAVDTECRPCMRRRCPGGHYRCREAVTPQIVMRALAEAGTSSPPRHQGSL